MEIKHEIVKELQSETHESPTICKKALKHFNGDYNRAKISIDNNRWSRPLSGVIYTEPDEDSVNHL